MAAGFRLAGGFEMTISRSKWLTVGALVVATVMVLSSSMVVVALTAPNGATASPIAPGTTATVAPSSPASGAATTAPAASTPPLVQPSAARAAGIEAAKEAFLAQGGNLSDFFPPTINVPGAPTTVTGGHVVPLYDNVPAPMGIATYGLRTGANGQIQPYVLNTKSVLGTFTTGDPYGVEAHQYDVVGSSGASVSFGAQLNCIFVNVTIKGQTGVGGNTYNMWLQNVPGYTPSTGALSFSENIWNFSYNPWGNIPWAGYSDMQAGTFITTSNTTNNNEEIYSGSGGRMTVFYPFTINTYINTSVTSPFAGSPGVDTVYMNYSVYNSAGVRVCPTSGICGSYNTAYFNSRNPAHPSSSVNPTTAQIQANGYHYAGNGNGTNLDIEWDFGIGSSDAEVSTIQYANGLLNLYTLNATTGKYQVVPSAYDFGSETGEATQGAYGTYSIQANGAPIEQDPNRSVHPDGVVERFGDRGGLCPQLRECPAGERLRRDRPRGEPDLSTALQGRSHVRLV